MLLVETNPELAKELRDGLGDSSELGTLVDTLELHGRCQCAQLDCGTFHTRPAVEWHGHKRAKSFCAGNMRGLETITTVDGVIVQIEFLERPDIAMYLDEHLGPVSDIIGRLFATPVLERLARSVTAAPSQWDGAGEAVRLRHVVFGPYPQVGLFADRRARWQCYLASADRLGLLDDDELRSNLTGTSDESFRGAMAECLVAWFLECELSMKITPKPPGRPGKVLDFEAMEDSCGLRTGDRPADLRVEVKAPRVPVMQKQWYGDDSDAIRRQIRNAGRQFATGETNVVVLVPALRTPVHEDRDQLLHAAIGEHVVLVPVTQGVGEGDDAQPGLQQNGKLAKLLSAGASVKSDLTRVSAVVTLEEVWGSERNPSDAGVKVVVVHNPFAEKPLDRSLFSGFPQWVLDGEDMYWTDLWPLPGTSAD